jgi:hypothetical protein
MVECASGPTTLLDTDAFVEGLTSDVEANYDFQREHRISTNFQDVFGDSTKLRTMFDEEFGALEPDEIVKERVHDVTFGEACMMTAERMKQNCLKRRNTNSRESAEAIVEGEWQVECKADAEYERVFTAPAIDFASDNYHTRLHGVIVWIAFVTFYAMYFLIGATGQYESNRCSEENRDFLSEIFCPFISGAVNSLLVVLELIVFGTPFVW